MATAAPAKTRTPLPTGEAALALGVLGLVLIMAIPLPPMVLDMLLAGSVSLGILLFLSVLYVEKPVDFSVFPILLLVTTVLRLALNVASTRLILLNGGTGSAAAGRIIEAFGQFVVGGNYAVGIVVFAILVLINFMVITKGAGRVAEVGARFTLDAMPGKQMAVDAELNAGLIDETQARARRSEIAREADFYGAMDGASKFIRGDAVAGLLITAINIVGGVFIGAVQGGMGLEEALRNYTILTIGDGLVGQIPALIVSTAAGLLVTRVQDADGSAPRPLHQQISDQLFGSSRVLWMLAVALASAAVAFQAWRTGRAPDKAARDELPEPTTPREVSPEDLLPVDPLAIEVGVDLLYLVDDRHGSELVGRVQRVRNQFAQDYGVVLPVVHLRDNLRLDANQYRVLLRGEELAKGTVYARQHLALKTGATTGPLKGIKTKDPVFDLPGVWISDKQVLNAQVKGYTVVDVPTVLTTHFVELMNEHAAALYDGVQLDKVLERIQAHNPRLVEDLVPDKISRTSLLHVVRNLITEGLSVRDMETILEALADHVGKTRDPDMLTEFVRQRLRRHITHRFAPEGTLEFVTFGPRAEDALMRALVPRDNGTGMLHLDPVTLRMLRARAAEVVDGAATALQVVLLVPPALRAQVRAVLGSGIGRTPVLSAAELLPTVQLKRLGVVELPETAKSSSNPPRGRSGS